MRFEEKFFGLNEWARNVTRNASSYRAGRLAMQTSAPVYLIGYSLPDGRIAEEFLQAAPWSDGTCYFLALRERSSCQPIAESLWRDDQIESHIQGS